MKIKLNPRPFNAFLGYLLVTNFLVFCLFSCTSNLQDEADSYPDHAAQVVFTKLPGDSLRKIDEWDMFKGSEVVVGEIISIDTVGDRVYLSDVKVDLIHILDRETKQYLGQMGSSGAKDPSKMFQLSGVAPYHGSILVSNSSGPVLKSFAVDGTFQKNLANSFPLYWGFPFHNNNFFIHDSTAFLVKRFAHNGNKVIRLGIANDTLQQKGEILKVSDFHGAVDSATMSNILTRFFLLKRNLGESFYALPANKFLVNEYSFDGSLIRSVDLRSIPELSTYYQQASALLNVFFHSTLIDGEDNIYIIANEIIDSSPAVSLPESHNTFIVRINLENQSYSLLPIETRSIAPMEIINGQLWCYDFMLSQIVLYQL